MKAPWWRRLFGQKGLTVNGSSYADSVVAGYPSWAWFDSYGAMYRRQPAVRGVVDYLARNIAQLNPKIYMRVSDTDRIEVDDHPVAGLLRRPNPTTTRYAHLRDTVADIAIYDRAYWRMMSDRRGLLGALVRIPPSRVTVEVDQETLRTTFRVKGEVVGRDEMVVFHGYHPDGGDQGVSPLETLRRVLAEEWASQTHREWYWRNAARQGGIIERPLDAPDWSPEARKAFLAMWQDQTTGGVNSGRTGLLEDGMKWRPGGFSPKDSEYIEGRKLTYEEVWRMYAPSLVGLLGETPGGVVESFHRQVYQDVLPPILRMIQDEVDGQILGLDQFRGDGSFYCEFNLAEKLRGSFEEQGRTLVTSVGVPYMSVNEGRARLNLPRIDGDWADVPVQPLNVLYGGQPSVVVPSGDPGTPAGVGGGGGPGQPAVASATPRELAEIVQKIYLGVGVVLSTEEARNILTQAGAQLDGDLPSTGTGLRSFLEHQEKSICSQLGALKDNGAMTVEVVWQDDRWERELAKVYRTVIDAGRAMDAAQEVNQERRAKVAAAFAEGGVEAVHGVFAEAIAEADQLDADLRQLLSSAQPLLAS